MIFIKNISLISKTSQNNQSLIIKLNLSLINNYMYLKVDEGPSFNYPNLN